MTVPPLLPDAPGWFTRAVSVPYGHGSVDVDGCPVHYLHWGEPGRRGLVFVHGGGAHAHWWTPGGRDLRRRVPGGGDRPVGPRRQRAPRRRTTPSSGPTRWWPWPADAGIDGVPVVIGHSMGGFITIVTAAHHAEPAWPA